MKNFKYLSIFAAAALMTSCASDAPEAPTTVDEGEAMYVSLTLQTPQQGTRLGEVGTDKAAETYEDAIKTVTLYLEHNDTYLFAGTVNGVAEGNATKATFKVPTGTFTTLQGITDEVKFFVTCNVAQTIFDPFNFDADLAFANAPYSTSATPSDGDFMMSGYAETALEPIGTKDGKTPENAWRINKALKVDRLAARIDYSDLSKDDFDAATSNPDIKFSLLGSALCNTNDQEYLFLHQRNDIADEDGFFSTLQNYQISWNPETPKSLNTLGGETYNAGTNGIRTEYLRPKTNLKAGTSKVAKYNEVTYIAFKAKMEVKTGSAFKDDYDAALTGNKPVYSYRGIYIGSAANMENYTGTQTSFSDNDIRAMWAQANAKGGDIDANLKALFEADGLFQYGVTDGSYYCYYFKAIHNTDAADADDAQKYAVVRNHLYDVKVKSIDKCGYPGTYTPDDIDPKYQDYYFDVLISVNKWAVRNNHFEF